MSLKSLLNTALSPAQEDGISSNASHCLSIIISSPSIISDADEPTVNKFKVRISALIKSKLPIARWFGCYLVKVCMENKFYSIIKSHGGTWAGLIQHILEVKEPIVTHQVAIQALSSIFAATYGKPNFTRDITTPRLAEYVKQLFVLAEKEPQLWGKIVRALSKVLSQQSTTFRPFTNKYYNLLTQILSNATTDPHSVDKKLIDDSCQGIVLLHMSSPKGKEQEEWKNSIISTISEINFTIGQMANEIVDEDSIKTLLIDPRFDWLQNIKSGESNTGVIIKMADKLDILISLLKAFFITPTKVQVNIPYGEIMHLADRLFSLQFSMEKPGVESDRRRNFYASIDEINCKFTELIITTIPVVGQPIVKYLDTLVHHINNLLQHRPNNQLKLSLFRLATGLINESSILPNGYNSDIEKLIRAAMDLIEAKIPNSTNNSSKAAVSIPDMVSVPDAFIQSPDKTTLNIVNSFLAAIIGAVPELPLHLRSQIDRHFIMSNHEDATLSALYPGVSKYSIAPIAARINPESQLGSVLMHPRFPPLSQVSQEVPKSARLIEEENESTEVLSNKKRRIEAGQEAGSEPKPEPEQIVQEKIIVEETKEVEEEAVPVEQETQEPINETPIETVDIHTTSAAVSPPKTSTTTENIPVNIIHTDNDNKDAESDIEIPSINVDSDSEDE